MLNLALKGAITFEKNEKDEIVININHTSQDSNLKPDELSVYNVLSNTQKYIANKKDDNINEIEITMKDVEKYAKNNDRSFLSNIEGIEENVKNNQAQQGNYEKSSEKASTKWRGKKTAYYVTAFIFVCSIAVMIVVPALILGIISSIICGILCGKLENKTRKLTQKGINEKEEWEALERYMVNFSMLDEREVPELVLPSLCNSIWSSR